MISKVAVFVLFVISSFTVHAQYETGAEYCAEKKSHFHNLSSLNKINDRLIPHTFDVLDYNLKFDLYKNFISPYPKSFNADEIITFRVDSVLNSIALNASNFSIIINSVSLAGVSFTHTSNILNITLDRTYNPGDTVQVGIKYQHQDVNDGSFLVGGGFVFTDNEPERARHWFPSWDKPSDKATVNITAKVPSNVKLGSNGRLADSVLTGDTIYYNWISRDPVATYLVVLTGKVNYNLDIIEYNAPKPSGNFPIRFYWNEGENVTALNNVKNAMQPMTELFERLFTKHPFEKNGFATVNSLFPWGGMENQTLTTLCGNCWGNMGLIVHEYAHQWFGDMITLATWADIWLNEGFATYSESLWLENTVGYSTYKSQINQTAARYMNNNPGWAISNPAWAINTPSTGVLFNYEITYMKGAVIHHLLRYTLGDDLYFAVMKAYANNPEFKYQSAAIADFISIVNSVTGEDYNWFFNQWIYSPNHPAYQNKVFIEDLGNNSWDVGFLAYQNLSNKVFFKMPVELKVFFAEGGDTLIRVMNEVNNQLFRFNFDRQPSFVVFDPDNNIVIKTASLTLIDPVTSSDEPFSPAEYSLDQNFPNPFNPVTNIKFETAENSNVTLTVYNLLGETVAVLINRQMNAGKYEIAFDASGIPSGIYIYKLDAGKYSSTRKMVLMK
jgi:aminopeptidase N